MREFFKPIYKVRRAAMSGLYYVEMKHFNPVYIKRVRIGSRFFYYVEDQPLYPTLRDAVVAIVYGS